MRNRANAAASRSRDPIERRRFDQHAAAGRARLTAVLHDRAHDRRDRRVEIGVGEDDLRRFSAQLEDAARMVLRGRRLHQCPDFRRTGEADHVDAGVPRQRVAGRFAQPGHDVDRAGREAASAASFASSTIDCDASSDGLITVALPTASEGASERANICVG